MVRVDVPEHLSNVGIVGDTEKCSELDVAEIVVPTFEYVKVKLFEELSPTSTFPKLWLALSGEMDVRRVILMLFINTSLVPESPAVTPFLAVLLTRNFDI